MPNRNKQVGSLWERQSTEPVDAFLTARLGHLPHGARWLSRPLPAGREDTGDRHLAGLFAVQCKAYADEPAGVRNGIDGAVRQARAAGLPFPVAFVKRNRSPVGNGFAVMRIEDWTRLIVRLLRAEIHTTDETTRRESLRDLETPFIPPRETQEPTE